VTAALWYLVWPPRTQAGYTHQAQQTIGKFRSQVATARLWGRELDRDHTFLATASVGLDEMETDATNTLDQFAAYQPPAGQEPMRTEVTTLGDAVVTDLGELRIAARQGRTATVVRKAKRLGDLLDRIDTTTSDVSS